MKKICKFSVRNAIPEKEIERMDLSDKEYENSISPFDKEAASKTFNPNNPFCIRYLLGLL